jgi:hypothetical protein
VIINNQNEADILMLAREGLQGRLHKQQLQAERVRRAQMKLRNIEEINKQLKAILEPVVW